MPIRESDRGFTLVSVVLVVVLLGGLAGAVIAISSVGTRDARRTTERTAAFYLAEAGIDAAMYELGEKVDPDGNGRGNTARSSGLGTYSVTATEQSADLFQVVSVARAGDEEITLQAMVEVPGLALPVGAMSVTGDSSSLQLLFGSTADLVLDGGPTPSMSVDGDLFVDWEDQVDDAIDDGYINASDLIGGGLTGIGSILPATETQPDFSTMWTDMRAHAASMIAAAGSTSSLSGGSSVFGTSSSPAVRFFGPGQKLSSGDSITGYGTLVFSRDFIIENGASVDWVGDIIVLGDNSNDAIFEVDGDLDVEGSFSLIGGAGRDAVFLVKSDGDVDVEGSVTAATDYATNGTKLQFLVENDFDLEGVLTTVASIHQTEWKPGCDASITGTYLFGLPPSAKADSIQFKVEDDLAVTYDETAIFDGLTELDQVGGDLGFSPSGGTVGLEVTATNWQVIHP